MATEGKHFKQPPEPTPLTDDEVRTLETAHRARGSRTSRVLLAIGIVLLAIALIGGGWIVYRYWKGDNFYKGVQAAQQSTGDAAADGLNYALDIDWASLRAQNPDIVGWVQIPDTVVDYPIAQTTDNDYYLTHDFAKDQSSFGCIFLDYESAADFDSDRNSIVYGHHMRNGSMFKVLSDYTDQSYADAHPYIYLATPDGVTHCLKAFCVVVASGDEQLRQTKFTDDAEFRSYVQAALDRNSISTAVTADQVTHLFTFATCSYQFSNARTLVYAVEIDKYGNIVTPATTSNLLESSPAATTTSTDTTAGTGTTGDTGNGSD